MQRPDIHDYEGRYQRALRRIEQLRISEEDKEFIMRFKDYCLTKEISVGKISAYLFYLVKFTQLLKKPIMEATKKDIARILSELSRLGWGDYTRVCFKIAIRRLYQIIHNLNGKEYPEIVRWINTNKKNKQLLPEEILTNDEINTIIRSCTNLRDKTFIMALAESGARISELATMRIKYVSFENVSGKLVARLIINGKTGMRKPLVVRSAPYLKEWISEHPNNLHPENFLWSSDGKSVFSYNWIAKIIKRAARAAGIKKRVYPHLFRHSRASYLANFMTESQLCEYFGWKQGSDMPRIYVHLSGRNLDEAVLKINGIYVQESKVIGQKTLNF